MLLRLKRRADSFDNWATEVKRSLDPSDPKVGKLVKNFISFPSDIGACKSTGPFYCLTKSFDSPIF